MIDAKAPEGIREGIVSVWKDELNILGPFFQLKCSSKRFFLLFNPPSRCYKENTTQLRSEMSNSRLSDSDKESVHKSRQKLNTVINVLQFRWR